MSVPLNRRVAGRLAAHAVMAASGLAALFLFACSSASLARPPGVQVVGALDVLPLAEGMQAEFHQVSGLAIDPITSTTSLAQLKSGQADVALIGRELSPDELQGLDDHVVAYDAVCLLINSRTFTGGIQQTLIPPVQLFNKYVGLSGLTSDDVKGFVSNILHLPNGYWQLHGLSAGYYDYEAYLDDNGLPVADPSQQVQYVGIWVWNDVALDGEMSTLGELDTQTALLQKLGYPETDVTRPGVSLVPTIFENEEELISFRFKIDRLAATPKSDRPFIFYVAFRSRRITVRALEYGFALRAIPINGIDPVSDANAVYTGAYPFSRKIHVLTRQPASVSAQAFVRFLLSPAGQLLIARSNYLPLPPGSAGN